MTTTTQRPPVRPVLDLLTGAGRYARATREGFTQQMVADAIGGDGALSTAYNVLTSMVCGGLLFMRCGPHPTTAPKYEWAYVPTARCWRMLKATAKQGGPTEEQLREDMTAVLVYGERDPRVRRW